MVTDATGADALERTLAAVWRRLATTMEQHYSGGRQHLLTEDVVRFATVVLLEEHGIEPECLAIETAVPGPLRGKLDLTIGADAAIEFKFPRDPHREVSAADTMTFGGLVFDPAPAPWPAEQVRIMADPVPPSPRAVRDPGGARREILDSVDALAVRSGSPLFTVRDVVDELERRGTRYAVSTITTMITSHMCVDGRSPTGWPDLRRVDRGVYRRLRPGEAI